MVKIPTSTGSKPAEPEDTRTEQEKMVSQVAGHSKAESVMMTACSLTITGHSPRGAMAGQSAPDSAFGVGRIFKGVIMLTPRELHELQVYGRQGQALVCEVSRLSERKRRR